MLCMFVLGVGGRGAALPQSDQQVQNREDVRTVLNKLLRSFSTFNFLYLQYTLFFSICSTLVSFIFAVHFILLNLKYTLFFYI